MNYNVQKLEIIGAYKLKIKFEDNLEGIVTVPKNWLQGVFSPLQEESFFKTVFINEGAVAWKIDGKILDLAPDTMYEEIKGNNGVYVLGERTVC